MLRLLLTVLRRILPPFWADDAIGDLTEDWRVWRRTSGPLRAGSRAATRVVGLLGYAAMERARGGLLVFREAWPGARRLVRRPLLPIAGTLAVAPALAGLGAFVSLGWSAWSVPLPDGAAPRLATITHEVPDIDEFRQSAELHLHYEDTSELGRLGLFRNVGANVRFPARLTRVAATQLSSTSLELLGATVRHGRLFTTADDLGRGDGPLLLTHETWERVFEGDSTVVGRRLEVDGRLREVAGVLDEHVTLPGDAADLVLAADLGALRAAGTLGGMNWTGSIASLPKGMSEERAQARLTQLLSGSSTTIGTEVSRSPIMERLTPVVRSWRAWQNRSSADILATGTVVSLLLLALTVSAVFNVLLARSAERGDEIDTRRAMGAGPGRLRAHLGLEAAMTFLLAAVTGSAGAVFLTHGLAAFLMVSPDTAVSSRAALLALGAGMVLVPGMAVASPLPRRRRPGVARGSRAPLQGVFLAAQLAAAVVLVGGACGLVRSTWNLATRNLGFDPERLVTFGVVLPPDWADRPAQALALHEGVAGRLRELPGVHDVAFGVGVPGAHAGWMRPFEMDAPDVTERIAAHRYRRVSSDYLSVLDIPLVAGRGFTASDGDDPEGVAVVNEAFARLYWTEPEESLGRRLREAGDAAWARVIGVVANTADVGPAGDVTPIVYLPLSEAGAGDGALRFVQFAVRGPTKAADIEGPIVQAFASLAPGVPAFGAETGVASLRRSTTSERLAVVLVGAAAGGAILTVVLGLGGMLLLLLLQRRWELGVRKALGASECRLRMSALRPVIAPLAIGIAVGSALITAGLRVPGTLLFRAGPWTLHLGAALGLMLPILALTMLIGTRHIERLSAVALRKD